MLAGPHWQNAEARPREVPRSLPAAERMMVNGTGPAGVGDPGCSDTILLLT
jgi:hypothetical protein